MNNMNRKYFLLWALLALGAFAAEDFEQGAAVPGGWSAAGGASVRIVRERCKSGQQSLLWSWSSAGDSLVHADPAAFRKLTADNGRGFGSCLGMWVYNETPTAAPMRCELRNGDQTVARFWFWMDFRGWRPLMVRYSQIGWSKGQAVTGLRIMPPEGLESGRLYIDGFDANFIHRGPARDYQMPWVGHENGLADPAAVALSSTNIAQNRPWLPELKPVAAFTAAERADLARLAEALPKLRERVRVPVLAKEESSPGTDDMRPAAEPVAAMRAKLKAWGIVRENGVLRGPAIGNTSPMKPAEAVHMAEYMKLCGQVRNAFQRARDPDDAGDLARMFVDLAEHLLDQGWAEGSGNMGSLGNGYGLRDWPPYFYSMRDVLAEAGILREVALGLSWHMGWGHSAMSEHPGGSMDTLNNYNRALLPCALMMPDEAERLQRLRVVQRHFSLALTNPRMLGPDGSAYHHGMHHFAYASYSMGVAFRTAHRLRDTVFRLSPEAHEHLRAHVHAMTFATVNGQQPPNMNARAGAPLNCDMSKCRTILADIDASAPPAEERDRRCPQSASGHWTMNGTAASLHRRDDWLVSIVGMIKFWRGLEIYGWTQTNNYGEYARYGSVLVCASGDPVSLAESGMVHDGWDWCKWPGTTALQRPSHEIFRGYAMRGNPTAFAGGTRLEDDGVWGMDFQGRDVHFRKSVFCFDKRVTVVTTNIRSDEDRPALTTLFQAAIDPQAEALTVNGESIAQFPWESQLPADRLQCLTDGKGNGYLVHPGESSLRLHRKPQEWVYMTEKYLRDPADNPIQDYRRRRYRHRNVVENEAYFTPSTNNFATAWFEHGAKPTDAACAYTIFVQSSPEELVAAAATPPYTVLRQDEQAHILHDHPTGTTAYVIFDETVELTAAPSRLPPIPHQSAVRNLQPSQKRARRGQPPICNLQSAICNLQSAICNLQSASRPCLVMLRRHGRKRLTLSVASTDKALTEPIVLAVPGRWRLAGQFPEGVTATAEENLTRVHVPYRDYMPVQLDLRRRSWFDAILGR